MSAFKDLIFSIKEENQDMCLQKMDNSSVKIEPFVSIKREKENEENTATDTIDGKVKLDEEILQDCNLSRHVKQEETSEYMKTEYCPRNLVGTEQDPLATDTKIESVKEDNSDIEIKEELITDIQGNCQYRDNIDISWSNVNNCISNETTATSLNEGSFADSGNVEEDEASVGGYYKMFETNLYTSSASASFTPHYGVEIYECNECPKLFSHRGKLKRHIETVHKGIKNHKCNECHKTFSQADNLKKHINGIHKGIKNHKCNECHKIFSQAGSLKKHINGIHKGIKNHKCSECPKMFSQLEDLKRHINSVHKGIKNYECNICHKMFAQSGNLMKHINGVHNGIKNYKYSECKKMFSRLTNLKQHIKGVHQGIKNYKGTTTSETKCYNGILCPQGFSILFENNLI